MILKKTLLLSLITIMLVSSIMTVLPTRAAIEGTPNWNVTGNYVIDLTYGESHYTEYLALTQDVRGTIIGDSLALAGPTSKWIIDGGSVSGNTLQFGAYYETNPSMRIFSYATIQPDGSMSGVWYDVEWNTREGTWTTLRGHATPVENYVPEGSNVVVNPDPTVQLTFGTVTSPGTATVDTTTTPPEGYPPLPGIIGPYYNIQVTADFTGKVKVCITYDDTGLTLRQEQKLRLYTSDGVLPVGDINKDGKVDLKDLALITLAMGTVPGKTRWNPNADLNGDGKITLADLGLAAKHLGESSWIDITLSIDTTNNIICGETSHFSGFGVR